ncbi:haloacid dehalogenase-like hydrolase domain-containing protein [Phthorimaea operculella]|nr:haloacid dehalogenase-like hydrolase domain-containing protein [Phthorimaea operculella]
MSYKHVTHVLFDMDGLILNTEELYSQAFQNILSRYGKNYTFELKMRLMGLQSHETAEMIVKELELPLTPEQFQAECTAQFAKLFPDCQVMPGVQRLIYHLAKKNVPIGLATSSSHESYRLKVGKHHKSLFAQFRYKTFGSSEPEVKNGKPSPDIFIVAASKFPDKPSPEKVLVFEDAVNGVAAARAADMQVVMIPDPRTPKSFTVDATLVLDSMEQFKPELFGLPPYPKKD